MQRELSGIAGTFVPHILHKTMFTKTPLKQLLRTLDYPLLLAVLVTWCIGIAAIYSAAGGAQGLGKYYAVRQLIWGAMGACALVFVMYVDIDYLIEKAYWLYGFSCLVLLLLFILGHRAKGAQSWINLGFFQVQPIEFAKIGLAFLLAHHLTHFPPFTLARFTGSLLLCAASEILILAQPDLGGTLVFCAMIFVALIAAGSPKRYLFSLAAGALALLPVGWMLLKDYQKKRVLVFIDPELDPLGAGYNVIQSRIAVGSGHLFGKGFMQGTQSKLRFLPEPHTDFIFSVFAEEFGLVGCVILLLLLTFILWRMLALALSSRSVAKKILIASLTAWLWFHCVESIGMSIGLLPVTGLPLPFVSYGGSSLLAETIAVAIALKLGAEEEISRRENAPPENPIKIHLQKR